jgi:hypothetical protein
MGGAAATAGPGLHQLFPASLPTMSSRVASPRKLPSPLRAWAEPQPLQFPWPTRPKATAATMTE